MPISGHILITGANGFVGQHLNRMLLTKELRVSQVVRSASTDGQTTATQHVLDLTDRGKVAELVSILKPDYVIHLAGLKSREHDATQFRNIYDANLSMALNVIDACRRLEDFKRLIFLGSCDEYGLALAPYNEKQRELPVSAYCLSKLAITQILIGLFHSHGFPSVVLRPSVIYGPGQGDEMFISALIQSLLANRDFAMTNGEQLRDFVYISDVLDAIIKTLGADERIHGTVLNIGAGVSSQLKEISNMIADLIGSDIGRLIKFGAIQYRNNEMMNYSVNIACAEEFLGWSPSTDIKVGLQNTVKYFKESIVVSQNQVHA